MLYDLLQDAILQGFEDLVNSWLAELQDAIGNIATAAFFFEESNLAGGGVLTSGRVTSAFNRMYYIAVILLAAKLLYKGWCVYVLWRDGDPEVSPTNMVTGAIWAIVISAAFPLLYRLGINAAVDVVSTILELFPSADRDVYAMSMLGDPMIDAQTIAQVELSETASTGTFFLLSCVVFVIAYIIMIFQMLGRGIELLVWRICVPIAAVGLVNSDGGQWNNYLQTLLKQVFTTLYQYFCFTMAVRVLAGIGANLIASIAFLVAGIAGPKLFAQFMTPGGSGGGMRQVAMVARAFIMK